uniref:Uncharacterized protein n=1 Tax=Oryza rufipogon TaxID=4529 RepID=A0A0E0P989_ORYRU
MFNIVSAVTGMNTGDASKLAYVGSLDERLVTVDEVRVALAHCLQTALEVGAPRSTKPRMVRKAGASLISGAI